MRYAVYVLLTLLLSLTLFTYLRLVTLREEINREREGIRKLVGELRIKREKAQELKRIVNEEGIAKLEDMEALKRLMTFIDRLGKTYRVEVVGEVHREGSVWRADVKLEFKVKSGREISDRIRELLGSREPVVFMREVFIDRRTGEVKLFLSLRQPFFEGRGS